MSTASNQEVIDNAFSAGKIIKVINTIIGLAILIFAPFTKAPEFIYTATPKLEAMGFAIVDGMATVSMSQAGWAALTIFIGLLYLWILVDTFWPSLLGIVVIALNPNYTIPQIMAQYLGNPITVVTFFLFFFSAALVKSNVVNYVSNYILSSDKLKGRPWLLILTLIIAIYITSWLDVMSAVLVTCPIVYLILSECGYKPGDMLSTFMVGNILGGCTLAAVGDVIKGPFFYVNSAYSVFVANNPQLGIEQINLASWILFTVILSIVIIALILFSMRFIFKVDVSKLENLDTNKFKENKLPPMTWKHKTLLVLFLIYVAFMILPSILPASPFVKLWASKTNIGSMAIFCALVAIRRGNDPLINVPQVASAVPWGIFYVLAAAFFFGGIITQPGANIPIILEMEISSALQGVNEVTFLALVVLLGFVLTNLMNSIVCGIILSPVIITIALSYGFDAVPILIAFLYVLLSALLTPAAGFPGAMLYGNKEWLPGSSAVFYAVFFSIVSMLALIVVGIPLAKILF